MKTIMAVSRPLAVAIAAMTLLVASVSFEVAFHRSYTLEVQDPIGWQTIGSSSGDGRGGIATPMETRAGQPIEATRNDTITFRVTVDNTYPWDFSEPFDVRYQGVIVAEGELAAPARGSGEAEFTIPASTFFSSQLKESATDLIFPFLDVQIGSAYVSGGFQLREVK